MGSGKKWCATRFSFRTITFVLLLLYINDLPDNVTCETKVFADDTKIYSTINDISDTLLLQKNSDMANEWSYTWIVKFNVDKCKLLQLGKSSPANYYSPNLDDPFRSLICRVTEILVYGVQVIWNISASSKGCIAVGLVGRDY